MYHIICSCTNGIPCITLSTIALMVYHQMIHRITRNILCITFSTYSLMLYHFLSASGLRLMWSGRSKRTHLTWADPSDQITKVLMCIYPWIHSCLTSCRIVRSSTNASHYQLGHSCYITLSTVSLKYIIHVHHIINRSSHVIPDITFSTVPLMVYYVSHYPQIHLWYTM